MQSGAAAQMPPPRAVLARPKGRGRIFVVLLALVLAIIGTPRASATESISFDRVWWDGLSHAEQINAVEGLIIGYQGGFREGGAAAVAELDRNSFAAKKTPTAYKTQMSKWLWSGMRPTPEYTKTFGTYAHQIGDFYRDHPSLAQATVDQFFGCFADRPRFSCEDDAGFLRSVQP